MDREAFDRKYAARLNRQQQEAVHAVEGPVLLLAVPGSGKTTVLVTRLGYMLCCCGIAPDQILTMTYTRAAAGEMKQRFAALFGQDCPHPPEIRTINGVSSKIIAYYAQNCGKRPPFTLAEDEGALAKLVSDLYRDLCGEYPTQSVVKELRKSIAYAKNMMLPEERLGELDTGFEKFPELYREYGKALRDNKWMDYDDQMVYAKKILELHEDVRTHFQNRFPYICVDESQDTSRIQHAIIRLLAGKSGNIFMVGDEDQSIYGFRAAYPDALMQFEQTYPGARVLLMEENYRSTPEILRAADAFIRKNHHRRPKTIHPTRASGAAVRVIYAMDRADQYPWLVNMAASVREETAVLYRNNDSALPLIDLLDRGGIPDRCRRMDDAFFTHRIVADIRDIIALVHDQTDAETFLRIYYKVGGGISKKAAEYACQKSRANGGSILRELLGFPQLSQYGRDSAAALLTMLPMLLQDNAAQGLSRIWDGLRYRDYAERQKLDGGKYEILCLLARQESGLEGLCRRLDELQALVSAPSLPCGGGLILSTVHSSKGLEYDTVYLLDVLDGILPAVTEPKDAGQQDQYQEERRLFYVAVTRARNRLYLFSCRNRESAFADELRRELPREYIGPEDVFASLNTEPCGKHYRHAEKGGGVIRACCRGQCMVAYASGETEFLTLGQMVDRRAVAWRAPDRPAPAALPREQAALPPSGVRPGQRAVHRVFGPGTVLSFRDPIVEIRFPAKGDKKFVLSDSVQRGLLRLEE